MIWRKLKCGLVGIQVMFDVVGYQHIEILGHIFGTSGEFEEVQKEEIAGNSEEDFYHEGMLNDYNIITFKALDSYSISKWDVERMVRYAAKDNRLDISNGFHFKNPSSMKFRYPL